MNAIAPMPFFDLLQGVAVEERTALNPLVSDIAYDSRRVVPGAAFVAMRGGSADGNGFIENALSQGAAAVVTDSSDKWGALRTSRPNLAIVLVEHGRRALAGISANFFHHPERALRLSGVTGTNGKTTTTYLLEAMLRSAGRSSVLIGTIEYHVADKILPSLHTTPESRDIFEVLADGVAAGATEAVMEVSSHALDQGRVWGLPWDVAVFTNLTQDHLDYHGDMESYFSAKAKMFTGQGTAAPRVAVIHSADPYGARLLPLSRNAGSQVITYGLERGEFRAERIELAANASRFRMMTPRGHVDVETHLAGVINVLNLLAASAAAMARGLGLKEIERGIAAIRRVPGRFETVDCGQPFTVAIDYAHTDDALRNVTRHARQLAATRGGRVITVFGCGGDRDRAKRPKMGRAAGGGSDFVVVTSDNPRSEDPAEIIREILPGVEETGVPFAVEADRAHAIRIAIEQARENDVVLIAGKGHEKVQVLNGRTIPLDDVEEAQRAILEASSARTRGLVCG